ncbi:MAG: hypothetical protein OEV99_13315 [Nitrospira sp.]|nr:hypothetical protein [Nitrospira sp.]MDH4370806.1 hypothetical protein [Nitrospira sp.]MDH5498605.1 hypothetical protein [Nitrospira sp.]
MIRKDYLVIIALTALTFGCSSVQHPAQPDVVDVTLPAPADQVKAAVSKVLKDDNYDVEWKDGSQLNTGYRGEQPSIWDWLVRGRFGVVRSRAEASVTPETDQTTKLHLQVSSEGKRSMFDSWGPTEPQVPQSAENKLRLIKNELKIVPSTYTTETFYGAKN